MRRTKSLASENEHRFSLQLGHAAAGKQCCGLHGEALVFLELYTCARVVTGTFTGAMFWMRCMFSQQVLWACPEGAGGRSLIFSFLSYLPSSLCCHLNAVAEICWGSAGFSPACLTPRPAGAGQCGAAWTCLCHVDGSFLNLSFSAPGTASPLLFCHTRWEEIAPCQLKADPRSLSCLCPIFSCTILFLIQFYLY